MNKFAFLLFALILVLLSCDGRHHVNKKPRDILIEKNLYQSFAEQTQYFPESYTETITDTILSNGYRVTIKSYTDMTKAVLQSFEEDYITNNNYYREFVSEIEVFKDDRPIFKQVMDDNFLSEKVSDYVSTEIYIDQQKSLETNTVHIIASQCIPRSTNCPTYNLTIEANGDYNITKQS
ncbi:hypothetical protein [Olleya namhaensis]|uniref:hypothetical protein n=1 Tax=Olleya namhaensis TaxID=1144750 RepID=UPI00249029D9|nr:hypothetical protein [Olleya namhaensis]